MALTLHLKDFEGPLDMLLFLIGKAKVDIRDIFVSDVTDQYIRSVREADDLDMDDASAFINMAATLVEIKSRSLLPKPPAPEDEEDPEKVLIRQLEEYQRFKKASEELHALEEAAGRMFSKLPEEYPLPPPTFELTGLDLEGLVLAFQRVLERAEKRTGEENAFAARRIVRDAYDVPGCVRRILRAVRKGSMHFYELFSPEPTRDEVVTLFLALLELIRLGRVTVLQEGVYEDIVLNAADPPREAAAGNADGPGDENAAKETETFDDD